MPETPSALTVRDNSAEERATQSLQKQTLTLNSDLRLGVR